MKYSVVLKNDLIGLLGNFINLYSYKVEEVDKHSKKIFLDIPEDKVEDLRKALSGTTTLVKISDTIRKTSKGFVVFSEKGKKLSKPYPTKEEAEKRLKQIEYFKHATDSINVHETLNEKLWNADKTLKKEVSDKINDIVEKFLEWLENDGIDMSVEDIIIVGSNASYNYTAKSDLDLHIICKESDDLLLTTYNLYKSLFNKEYDITFNGIDVELYIQHDMNEIHSLGIYSVKQSRWLKEPNKEEIPTVEFEGVDEEVEKIKKEYEKLVKNGTSKEIDKLINKIYEFRGNDRTANFAGEFGKGNLIFKALRDLDILEKLKNLKTIKESEELSIKDSEGVKDMIINGTIEEFDPKNLIEKIKERREPLHTNRMHGNDTFVISVDAHGDVEKPESIWVDVIKLHGKKQDRVLLEKATDWENAIEIMENFKKSTLAQKPFKIELPHIEAAIQKLNAPSIIDGEEYESLFDFTYGIKEDKVLIYDKNEAYSIDYLEEKQGHLYEAWEEFGKPKGQPKPDLSHVVDEVYEQLEKAVKEDLGQDALLEWENNLILVTYIPEEKFGDK